MIGAGIAGIPTVFEVPADLHLLVLNPDQLDESSTISGEGGTAGERHCPGVQCQSGVAVTGPRPLVATAGLGRFVEPVPRPDSEFRQSGNQWKTDLLTAVMHELGHVLGKGRADDGVMANTLNVGIREVVGPIVMPAPGRCPDPSGGPAWFPCDGRRESV